MMLNLINNVDTGPHQKVLYLYHYTGSDSFEDQINVPVKIYRQSSGIFLIKYLKRLSLLFRIIRNENVKVIVSFANQGTLLSSLAKIRFRKKRLKIIARQVSFFEKIINAGPRGFMFYLVNKFNYQITLKFTYKMADRIVCQTDAMAEDLIKRKPALKDKVEVIHNFLDQQRLDTLAQSEIEEKYLGDYFISVSRISSEKNISGIIDAFDLIKNKVKENYVVIGEGPLKNELMNKVREMKLGDRVFFLGYKSNPIKYIKHADFFVLNSIWEGLSNAVIEAMACKTPVISSYYEGIEEIIQHEKNGWIVPNGDMQELSRAMLRISQDPALRTELSENGYRNISKFTGSIHRFNQSIAVFTDN